MWLPEDYRPRQGSTLREPTTGALDHPILVLSVTVTDHKDAIIYFAILRSFSTERKNSDDDSVDISKQGYPGQYEKIAHSSPKKKEKTAKPPPPLTLESRYGKNCRLQQTSYVDLSVVYSAQLADLRVYKESQTASFFRLKKGSFKYVWDHINGGACGVGMGALWTWVPTTQLRDEFAKCAAIRVRDDALKASINAKRLQTTATTPTSAYGGASRFILLLLRLPPSIISILAAPSSQLGLFPRYCLLHWAGLAAGTATPEETATTREGTYEVTSTHMLTYMFSAVAVAMVSCRLSVRLDQVARKRLSVDLVCAELMGDAALLAGIVYVGFVAKQSTETRGSPVQAAAASMAAGMSGPRGQEKASWPPVSYASVVANGRVVGGSGRG